MVSKGGMSMILKAKPAEDAMPWKVGWSARSKAELGEKRVRLKAEFGWGEHAS